MGKSTLFNRLVGKRGAIVDNVSGVTRDRNYGEVEWCGKEFQLIDLPADTCLIQQTCLKQP